MYLCDQLGEFARFCRKLNLSDQLMAAVPFAERVRAAPHRFILGDDVVTAVLEGMYSNPEAMLGCLPAIRIPWRRSWFEWGEDAAEIIHARYRKNPVPEERMFPKRCGFLLEADATGRSGRIWIMWPVEIEDLSDLVAVAMQAPDIEFDLDSAVVDGEVSTETIDAVFGLEQLRAVYGRHEVPERIDIAAAAGDMGVRFRHACLSALRFVWSDAALTRETLAQTPAQGERLDVPDMLQRAVSDAITEYAMIFPIVAMMNAHRAVVENPISRGKLNKARRRQGRTELLDHVEVSMNLAPEERRALMMGQTGSVGPRRTHWVSGHLVNRGGTIHWRRMHLRRGVGDAPTRTIEVHGARSGESPGVPADPAP